MGDFFSNLSPMTIVTIVTLVALFVLGAIIIIEVVNKSKEKKFNFESLDLNGEKEQKRIKKEEKVHLFFWEEIIFKTLRIKNPSFVLITCIRISMVLIAVILGATFHFLAIYFVFEIAMYLYTTNKAKKVEDDNGLTFIPKTNAFLDMYIPAVNNGQSVNQIMDRFVDAEKDPELSAWWYSEDRENAEIPLKWNDVIKIYQNGYYSEINGNEDSAEVYQKDIMKQMSYYNNFKEKIGEINPIKGCYYIFMPIILLLSWINDAAFWSGIFGLLDTIILCMLLFAFSFLISDLHKETCQKLF